MGEKIFEKVRCLVQETQHPNTRAPERQNRVNRRGQSYQRRECNRRKYLRHFSYGIPFLRLKAPPSTLHNKWKRPRHIIMRF